MTTKAKLPIGRPQANIDRDKFLSLIAEGHSITKAAEKLSLSLTAVYNAMERDESFKLAYARTREQQAEAWVNKITDAALELLEPDNKVDPHKAKVAIEALKWTASKILPKTYGDTQRIELAVETRTSVLEYVLSSVKERNIETKQRNALPSLDTQPTDDA
jgi:molybdenum-dependent DNA-binding transcriptional regulator ModE